MATDWRSRHWANSERRTAAFTVLELLVSIGILAALVALVLPAMMAAREAARRATCTNNLKQVATAIHLSHDRAGYLPHAWHVAEDDPQFGYGWMTEILPELEQTALSQRLVSRTRPGDLGSTASARLPLAVCPSDISEPVFDLKASSSMAHAALAEGSDDVSSPPLVVMSLPTANYQGVFGTVEADEVYEEPARLVIGDGPLVHDRRMTWANLERGLSCTLLVGERTMAMAPSTWLGVDFRGDDATCRLVGSAMTQPNCVECDECEFSSRHPGGASFAWADGRVTLIADDVDSLAYQQFAKREVR